MKKCLFIILAVVVVTATFLSSCGEPSTTTSPTTTTLAPTTTSAPTTKPPTTTTPAEPETLKIGYFMSLSGFLSVYYVSQEAEVLAIADIYNENGGITIGGQQYLIEMVGEDTESSADGAAAGANRLVYDKGVKFVVGPFGFEAAASTPIFEENDIINVNTFPLWSPGELSADTPYSFAGNPGAFGETLVLFQALMMEYPDVETVVLMAGDDGTSPFMEPKYQVFLEDMGLTLLNDGHMVLFSQDIEDMSPIAAKVDLMKPDAVVQIGSQPPQASSFIKAFRALGNDVPYCFAGGQGPEYMIDALGPTANDVLTTGVNPDYPGSALHEELIARTPWTGSSCSVANSLIILLEVLKKSPSLDPADVSATWESLDSVEGLFGTVTFGGTLLSGGLTNHVASYSVLVHRVKDGEASVVGWVSSGPIP